MNCKVDMRTIRGCCKHSVPFSFKDFIDCTSLDRISTINRMILHWDASNCALRVTSWHIPFGLV